MPKALVPVSNLLRAASALMPAPGCGRSHRIVILFLVVTSWLAAQTTTNIIGTVLDRTGASVPDAQVTATNTATNLSRTAQTNTDGQYRLEFLPIGAYTVEVTAQGFKKFVQKGITLEINRTARVDATLDVGGITETVSVTGDAPLVNTDNAQIGRTVSNAEITDLPIVNRNVYTLLTTDAGRPVFFQQHRARLSRNSAP